MPAISLLTGIVANFPMDVTQGSTISHTAINGATRAVAGTVWGARRPPVSGGGAGGDEAGDAVVGAGAGGVRAAARHPGVARRRESPTVPACKRLYTLWPSEVLTRELALV